MRNHTKTCTCTTNYLQLHANYLQMHAVFEPENMQEHVLIGFPNMCKHTNTCFHVWSKLVFGNRYMFLQMNRIGICLQIHVFRGDHYMHKQEKNLKKHAVPKNMQKHLFTVTWYFYLHVYTCENMFFSVTLYFYLHVYPVAACR